MKVHLLCIFIALSWALTLAGSLAVPPNIEKPAEKNAEAHLTHEPAALDNRNVDLSKIKPPEKEAVEKEDDAPAVFDASQSLFTGYQNLKWVDWTGSLPSGAVSINNQYARRTDYICSVSNCATGFYSSNKGSFCFYSNAGQEFRSSTFQILVNEQNFEVLEWQRQSAGQIPSYAIQRCQGIYVGKNEYGLGKVIPSQGVLSIPFNGYEYLYDTYEVLRLYPNYHSQTLTSMSYDVSKIFYDEDTPITLGSKVVMNRGCSTLTTTVTLVETTQITKYWDIGRPTNGNVQSSLTGNMPIFSGSTVGYSSISNFEWQEGYPYIQPKQYSYSLQVIAKPNYQCEVVLQGRNLHTRMPLTGTLSRSYNNGQRRTTSIQGTFYNFQTDDVVIYALPCKRIINAPPCP